ncbi:MAG: T9SS type A sorting domain-containing protein [Bacteroidales bacterium]|nr:T9SS type A sorting domain-containing protein [Bacteroidales bacterium]
MKKRLLFWMGIIFPLLLSAQFVPKTPANCFISNLDKPGIQFDKPDLDFILNPTQHPLIKNQTLNNFKATNELKMGLDSLLAFGINPSTGLSELGGRYLFQYNFEGLLSSEEVIYKDEQTGNWLPYYRYNYTYNPLLLLTQRLVYIYDAVSSQYLLYGKTEYAYNTSNFLVEAIAYGWDQNNSIFIPVRKDEYTYLAGLLKDETNYDWDAAQGVWIGDRKFEYTYTSSGNQLQNIRLEFNPTLSVWEYYWKEDYTYNAGDTLIRETNWDWNDLANNWIEYSKREYEYSNNPIIHQYISYSWEIPTNTWVQTYKHVFELSADTTSGESIEYYWVANQWKPTNKDNYNYDSNFNPVLILETIWDDVLNKWENEYKAEYTHDLSYAIEDIMVPPDYFFEYITQNMLTENVDYDWDISLQVWEEDEHAKYYYSEHLISGIPSVQKQIKAVIYPNPSNESIRVSNLEKGVTGTIDIFDLMGKQVIKEIFSNQPIDIQMLKSGTYLYQILIQNQVYSGKLVVY